MQTSISQPVIHRPLLDDAVQLWRGFSHDAEERMEGTEGTERTEGQVTFLVRTAQGEGERADRRAGPSTCAAVRRVSPPVTDSRQRRDRKHRFCSNTSVSGGF